MTRKPLSPTQRTPDPGSPIADVGLAVKDGVRELRFNLLRGARRLVKGAQAVVNQGDAGPLSLLGEPLDRAVSLLRTADRAAVDFLSTDGPYRTMSVPLRSSASYFAGGTGSENLAQFIHDHYWRYRHWITLKGSRREVFVREQGIERAGVQVRSALVLSDVGLDRQLLNAQVVLALGSTPILEAGDEALGDFAGEWSWHAAFCTVLAGEIAPGLSKLGAPQQTAAALELAEEITTALRTNWQKALQSPQRAESLAACLEFALRHL